MLGIVSKRSRALTPVMKFFTLSGTLPIWFGTVIVLNIFQINSFLLLPEQEKFLRCMLAALLAWGVGSLMKRLVGRRRPSEVIPNYSALVKQPGASFPSSHVASTFAFAIALFKAGHPWAFSTIIWATFVSFSRFYLGVHFVSDIAGGLILGLFCSQIIFFN